MHLVQWGCREYCIDKKTYGLQLIYAAWPFLMSSILHPYKKRRLQVSIEQTLYMVLIFIQP